MRRLIRNVLGTLVLALAAWCLVLTVAGTRDHFGRASLIVVPATQVLNDGTPSARLRARCDCAAEVYRAGYAGTMLVSGGIDPRGHDEAAVMKRYLASRGVPPSVIVTDSLGYDSWQTMLHARAWLWAHHVSGVVLVSQGFHIPRLVLACRRLGVAPVYTVHARFSEPRDLFSLAREFPALAKYALRRVS